MNTESSNYGLEKFGLRKNSTLKLNLSQSEFYQKLKQYVYQKELNFWIFFTERYVKTERLYIGSFSHSKFELKRRTGFWGTRTNHTVASGKVRSSGDQIVVDISLGILPSFVQVYLVSALLGLFTLVLILPRLIESETFQYLILVIPVIFLGAILINLIAYRKQLKDFEREFALFLKTLENKHI